MRVKKTQQSGSSLADEIREGLLEAIAFERGERPNIRVDRVLVTSRRAEAEPPPTFPKRRILLLRKQMQLSQSVFASALNVSPDTVRAWEQGKNVPGGPALRLLQIAEEHPDIVIGKVIPRPATHASAGNHRRLLKPAAKRTLVHHR